VSETRPDPAAVLALVERDVKALIREAAGARFRLAEVDQQKAAAERKWLLGLIDVMDAFDRVFRSVESKPDRVTDQMKVWLGNFRAVSRLLDRQLADRGARRMTPAGNTFDPERQTILETLEDATREDGTIADEVRPGWERQGEILRKAEVRVVRNAE
jgi:molecular chaperone GrpE (heat shock protein)